MGVQALPEWLWECPMGKEGYLRPVRGRLKRWWQFKEVGATAVWVVGRTTFPTLSLMLLFVGPSLAEFHGREYTPARSVKGRPQSEVGAVTDTRRKFANTQEAVPEGLRGKGDGVPCPRSLFPRYNTN